MYYYRTSQEIQKNYEQSLRNQSQFLASESLELLEGGDRLTAVSLALEALPLWDGQRPWVADAEFALSRAVNAYGSSAEVLAVNAFTHDSAVEDYFLCEDGSLLISWDAHSMFYVWDTTTYQLVNTFSPGMELSYQPVLRLPEHRVLVGDVDGLRCFDYLTGQLLWENMEVCASDVVLTADCALAATGYSILTPVSIVDTSNGETVRTLSFPSEITGGYPSIEPMAFSPDGSLLALNLSAIYGEYRPLCCDLASGSAVASEFIMNRVDEAFFTEDNRLMICGRTEKGDFSTSMIAYGFTTLTRDQTDLYCLDPMTAQVVWSNSFDFYLPFFASAFVPGEYPAADGSLLDVVCCTYANVCTIFDAASGELVQRVEMPDCAVACEYDSSRLYWFLKDGSYCVHRLGSNSVSALSYFPNDLVDAETNRGFFVRAHGATQILLYRSVTDDAWVGFEGEVPMTYSDQTVAVSDDYIVVRAAYRDSYNCYRFSDRKYLQTLQLDEYNHQSLLGFAHDGVSLVTCDTANAAVTLTDLSTGEIRTLTLTSAPAAGFSEAILDLNTVPFLSGNLLGYVVQSTNDQVEKSPDGSITVTMGQEIAYELHLLDIVTGETRVLPLFTQGRNDYLSLLFVPDPVGTSTLMKTKRYDEAFNPINQTQRIFLDDGKTVPVEDLAYSDYGDLPSLCWSDDGKLLAAVCTDGIRILQPDGYVQATIDPGTKQPLSLCFDPAASNLLVVFDDATLHRYSVFGFLSERSEVYCYSGGLNQYSEISWQFSDIGVLVTADSVCTIIETDTWNPYTYVRQCMHYDPDTDCFYVSVSTDEGYVMGCYQRYSTRDLIDKAYRILGENTLTEAQRNKYGLD